MCMHTLAFISTSMWQALVMMYTQSYWGYTQVSFDYHHGIGHGWFLSNVSSSLKWW